MRQTEGEGTTRGETGASRVKTEPERRPESRRRRIRPETEAERDRTERYTISDQRSRGPHIMHWMKARARGRA